ncbi:MAG: serine hydrolase domain-containing protein [Candidatus Cryptobacteroides sp.]
MKIKSALLAVLAVLSFTTVSAHEVIYMKDRGIIPDTGEDCAPAVRAVLKEVSEMHHPVEVRFDKGRYDLYSPILQSCGEDSHKVFFYMDGVDSLTIDGGNCCFVCHGANGVFLFEKCNNLSVKNMSFDWERPLVSQGIIKSFGKGYVDILFDFEKYPVEIEDGKAVFICDGKRYSVDEYSYSNIFDPHTKEILQGTKDEWLNSKNALFRGRAKKRSGGIIRFYGKPERKVPEGSVIVLYHGRYMGDIFSIESCNRVLMNDINIYHSIGMGLRGLRVADLSLERFNTVRGDSRCFSAMADAVHLNMCGGSINLSECSFEGQGDDAVNIHGRYQRIDSIEGNRLSMEISSKWSLYDAPAVGEDIWFIDKDTMARIGKAKIVSVNLDGNNVCRIGVDQEIPWNIGSGCFIENATWIPDVKISGCSFGKSNRARGILLTSPGKMEVYGNKFRSAGSAILIEGDTNYWYESGAVKQLDIHDNNFIDCGTSVRDTLSGWGWGEAVITVSPSTRNCTYHKGITIRNNHFKCFDKPVLYARSVDSLVFRDNIIEADSNYNPVLSQQSVLHFEGCRNTIVTGNDCDAFFKDVFQQDDLTQDTGRLERSICPRAVEAVREYVKAAQDSSLNINSIIIVKGGKVIAEDYMNGWTADDPHVMWSVSKTFTSLAIGYAIEDGKLSLDEKLADLFPKQVSFVLDTLSNSAIKENILKCTVRDLLVMGCGHAQDPTMLIALKYGIYDISLLDTFLTDNNIDIVQEFFAFPFEKEPGTFNCYNSLGSYLLSRIVTMKTGEKVVDYLQPRLFDPLGITKPRWDEVQGFNAGGWGLYLKPEDMAKVGVTMLYGGKYAGKQVIPEAYLKEASSKYFNWDPPTWASEFDSRFYATGYGYQMWQNADCFYASGMQGQYIFVFPEYDLVITATALIDGNTYNEVGLIWHYILKNIE